MDKKPLWHVVLISFKSEASTEIQKNIYERYQILAEECGGKDAGILFWRVDKNLDNRKGVHLVEIAVFKSDEAFQYFRTHPKHKELTDILRNVADWQVGDIHYEFPG